MGLVCRGRHRWRVSVHAVVGIALALGGCGGEEGAGTPDAGGRVGGDGTTVRATIGPEGGEVAHASGASILIPEGAIDEPTEVAITAELGFSPTGRGIVYAFEPQGLVLARPARVKIHEAEPATQLAWTTPEGDEFLPIGGTTFGDDLSGQVVYLGRGYAAPQTTAGTVWGVQLVSHVSPGAIALEAVDLSDADVRAYPPAEGEDQAPVPIPGSGRADGLFSIEVPRSGAWVAVDRVFVWTEGRPVDLGYELAGRPEPAQATISPTDLVLNVTGMAPWQPADYLLAFSPGVNMWWWFADYYASSGAPVAGAVALEGLTLDSSAGDVQGHQNLLDGAEGDRLYVARMTERTTPELVTYHAMTELFRSAAVTQRDGQPTELTGAFEPTTAQILDLDFRADLFAAGYPAPRVSSFAVSAQPEGLAHGAVGPAPDFLVFDGEGSERVLASGVAYGTFLEAGWATYWFAQVRSSLTVVAQGATSGIVIGAGAQRLGLGDPPPEEIGPELGPVTGANADGRRIQFMSASGMGSRPTISWEPPTLGTPDRYNVAIRRIYPDGAASRQELVASLWTAATELKLPIAFLDPAQRFVVQITAEALSIPDAARSPYRSGAPLSRSTVASGLLSP